jgi:coenzyme F420 biosynthesis associated uncharacterized protein
MLMSRTFSFQGVSRQGRLPIDRRLIGAGLLAGAAVGAWASGRMRANAPADTARGLIDWDQARGIAINMNRGATLTSVERSRLDDYYRGLVDRCVPIVSDYTGTELPDTIERTFAFDRVDWINANLDSFKVMLAPIEALNPDTGGARSVAAAMWGGLNRTVVSAELGLLLGYLARRVLGQYDLALLGREPVSTGKLYYVEPNIRVVEQTLGLPRDEFRMWLALHETTHAFEFEAHPWVRLYFNDLLESYFEFLRQDAEHLKQGFRGLKVFIERARSGDKTESWIEAVMTPQQRELFAKMQATMCIVEGYSNHVMNAVGKTLLPSYDSIAQKFEQRQRQRTVAEQLFARLTGLDIKMEQYRLGQRFIDTIVQQRGHDVARRVWDGPESLPTLDEVKDPARWLARVIDRTTVTAGAAGE